MASNKGLMFIRKSGDKTIVVGIFDTEAVSKLWGEHQHMTVVTEGPAGMTTFSVLHDQRIDRTKEAHGQCISGLLCDPIWQN